MVTLRPKTLPSLSHVRHNCGIYHVYNSITIQTPAHMGLELLVNNAFGDEFVQRDAQNAQPIDPILPVSGLHLSGQPTIEQMLLSALSSTTDLAFNSNRA